MSKKEVIDSFIITIDREIVKEYSKYYFSQKENKRKKKFYIMNNWKTKRKNPKFIYDPISLNELLPISPPMYQIIKSQWGMFGVWLCEKYGHSNNNYKNAVVEYTIYNETKTRKDVDNYSAKILNDGLFSQSGMFEDDSYFFINPFIIGIKYDKEHPRTEIKITIIRDDIKDIYKKMDLHINEFKTD